MKNTALCIILLISFLGFSCDSADDIGVVLVDEDFLEAGSYDYIWDLTHSTGAYVSPGYYKLDMRTDNFSTSLIIEITIPSGLDAYKKEIPQGIFFKPIPETYGLSVDKSRISLGDSLTITYDLPQNDGACITFSQIYLDLSPF